MGDWGRIAISSRLIAPACDWINSLAGMLVAGTRPGDVWLPAPVRKAAHVGANEVVRAFLATDCDTLLTLDEDHGFPPDTLERLRSDPAGAEYDILMAMYAARGWQRALVCRLVEGTDEDYPEFYAVPLIGGGAIMPVDQVGLGFTLWRRRVFETLPDPWFWYIQRDKTTEDIALLRDARHAGFRVGVHTGVPIDHLAMGRLSVRVDG